MQHLEQTAGVGIVNHSSEHLDILFYGLFNSNFDPELRPVSKHTE